MTGSTSSMDLDRILRETFGYNGFRASQQQVCEAAIAGDDVLVVMPTGSGKSLCYQLPAIARGGAALVISPLIALMEDQVAKLQAMGLRVDRIHSGRPREEARAAFRAYRNGEIQFLFVAPERFRVPGFLPALTQRKPSLIAVDEAHCISQWGHDFRPDYRMLKDCVASLRPAPVIALTATATPGVQRDILQQLGLVKPAVFVQGFRRENIAVEVVQVSPSERTPLLWKILSDAGRRPAIVYAPSRKQADALAAELAARFKSDSYHAGLDARHRQLVQERFLNGDLEIIVATVAFGMGIDKPNIRTVVHVALPGTVEGYYQEIGRAGRDGKPSRAVLMHSYADRHMHDFFFERDYPEADVLGNLYSLLGAHPISREQLCKRSKLSEEAFESAFEKLWIHGGVVSDWEDNVVRGNEAWKNSYGVQRNHRSSQVELILRFASSEQCRMSSLVRYFGDATDKRTWCGICDFCAPESCVGQSFRQPERWEADTAERILDSLSHGFGKASGKLYTEIHPTGNVTRNAFEEVIGALARAGLVSITNESFEKDGRAIPYRSVKLTSEGSSSRAGEAIPILMRENGQPGKSKRPARPAKTAAAKTKTVGPDDPLVKALREWRLATAKRKGIPAFRILSDSVLHDIADTMPDCEEDLLEIRGIGLKFVEQYADDVFRIVHVHDRS